LGAVSALAASLFAQTPTPTPTTPAGNANATDNTNANGRQRRGGGGGGGNFNPADIQARMMSNLREQLAVKDDAEWSLISERITAVMDLRRSLATGGGFGGRGGNGGNGGNGGGGNNQGNRPNRVGAQANPELDALRSALSDNMPDAEIKARLDRLREVRKQNEAKLTKAQEELLAVLSVRQEAVAVAAGLLL